MYIEFDISVVVVVQIVIFLAVKPCRFVSKYWFFIED
jgi:hypothetical protein